MKEYTEWRNYRPDNKNKYGIWIVEGEDPNCDFGGSHYNPKLGTFEGYYDDVFEYAVTLNDWCAWGAGGDVYMSSKSIPIKIKSKRDYLLVSFLNIYPPLSPAYPLKFFI